MPHIIIEYTPTEETPDKNKLMRDFHDTAHKSGLFNEADIKVRSKAYDAALIGGEPAHFAHILVYLIKGRDETTKKALTGALHDKARSLFGGFQSVSVDARDLDKAVYTKSVQ